MATNLPSVTAVLSAYTAFTALVMVVKTVLGEIQSIARQILPPALQEKIFSKLKTLFQIALSEAEVLTLNIHEYTDGLNINELYEAAETYLSKIGTSNRRLNLSKDRRNASLKVTIDRGEEIVDSFEGIELRWVKQVNREESPVQSSYGGSGGRSKDKSFMMLSFHKQHKEKVLSNYIPYMLETALKIQDENKVVKLYKLDYSDHINQSINLQHPSTFDTLAMDPEVKRALIDDLDRFVRRRDFYRRVGKVWKRGYLFYGPPGTGKSSLVAAMANYLKFHIYDFDLKMMGRCDLRQLLVSTANRSIIVIEDIDCSTGKVQNRQQRFMLPFDDKCGYFDDSDYEDPHRNRPNQNESLPLAGLLNFVDGLWSSCGDERIIVFTTNYKERIDPALLRPGRMDMHIHLSYLTFCGFKTLASNYLNISSHPIFAQIEELIKEVQITPATVAEELMKSDDVDEVLEGLVQVLLMMKEDEQQRKILISK